MAKFPKKNGVNLNPIKKYYNSMVVFRQENNQDQRNAIEGGIDIWHWRFLELLTS